MPKKAKNISKNEIESSKEPKQLDLDIKAENIAWDEVNKKFVMYELSFKAKTTGFYIKNGFNGYLN